ncbi:MAG: hypothetical protein ACQETJ_13665, partial [Bacteroidota bacterium]
LEVFEENRNRGEPLYNLHLEEYELFFYAKDSVIQINTSEAYQKMLKTKNIWVYTTEPGYNGIQKYGEGIDTVFFIKYRGMNELNTGFLNPRTRGSNVKTNYLVRLK